MGRQWNEWFDVKDVGRVGYSLTKRGRVFSARFQGREGHVRVSTGQTELGAARNKLAQIVVRHFQPDTPKPVAVTWDGVLDKLRVSLVANNNRAATYEDYRKAIHAVRTTLPDAKGPNDITERKAMEFKERFISTTFSRGKTGNQFKRSHVTLNAYLRKARSLWSRWLIAEYRVAAANPWLAVRFAETDKRRPTAPDETVIDEFFGWVRTKFGFWELPLAFFKVKEVTGCRLADLCTLRADQFDGKRVTFAADQTKNRSARTCTLPGDVAALVERVRPVAHVRTKDGTPVHLYLWQSYPDGFAAHLKRTGKRTTGVAQFFSPRGLYHRVGNWMKDFENDTGRKLTTHDFRRRAVTLLVRAGWTENQIAAALDMTTNNVRNYLDSRRAVTDQHFAELGTLLRSGADPS